ncbi:Uncharacterised protein [Vibrio cholerae]|nr:Uncharacterised protein [Vibrio cholerae]CSI38372.1 Uncharacterised protein [Vibrio cholerae]
MQSPASHLLCKNVGRHVDTLLTAVIHDFHRNWRQWLLRDDHPTRLRLPLNSALSFSHLR